MEKIKLLYFLIICSIFLGSLPLVFTQTTGSSNCKGLKEFCSPFYNCCYGLTCDKNRCKVPEGGQCRTSKDCTHDAICILGICKIRDKVNPLELPLGVIQDKFFAFVDWIASPTVSIVYVALFITIIFVILIMFKYWGRREEEF